MDPNTTLRIIKSLTAQIIDGGALSNGQLATLAIVLAEASESMNFWLSQGGFLPDAWERRNV